MVDELYARGIVLRTRLTTAELALFAALTTRLGMGESATIAIAVERDWYVACDDGQAVKEAIKRLGQGPLL